MLLSVSCRRFEVRYMGLRSFLHRITAPRPPMISVSEGVKLVCVVNQRLKMGKGKIAAQVGHASVGAFLEAGVTHPGYVEAWLGQGQKKICLKAEDETILMTLQEQALQHNIPTHLVRDAGHTQIPKGSTTVLALGPFEESELDTLTGHLKLL